MDKKERLNINSLTKDALYPSDKKRVLELFVENDNTLSHLLEFISNKLVDNSMNTNTYSDSHTSQASI